MWCQFVEIIFNTISHAEIIPKNVTDCCDAHNHGILNNRVSSKFKNKNAIMSILLKKKQFIFIIHERRIQ